MIKFLLISLYLSCIVTVQASMVKEKSLAELLPDADHILAGHVVKVDMINGEGNGVANTEAMTGPGLENTIRLHVKIDEVILTSSDKTPDIIKIKLWNAWHFSLGQIQESAINDKAIYLLKGPDYEIVFPCYFQRDPNEKSEILDFINKRSGETISASPP